MPKYAGIDLGTTNSLLAVVKNHQPETLPVDGASHLLPSVVYYGPGEPVVGRAARDGARLYPRDTVVSVKRFMGRAAAELQRIAHHTPYIFDATPEGAPVIVTSRRRVTPVEVSAAILKTLKERAEAQLDAPLDGVVITVPAYFDDGQRQATKDAGRVAGLNVLRLVNEPTAAALAYGLNNLGDEGVFAVFDLGGGTFDISILRLVDGVFEVRATGGDSLLGGDDFDLAIAQEIFAELAAQGVSVQSPEVVRTVIQAAVQVKHALTDAPEAELAISLPGGIAHTYKLARAHFEDMIRPILERVRPVCEQALADSGFAREGLRGVILVGGATRTPLVRKVAAAIFGMEPLAGIDPDRAVALGAAVQADILTGSSQHAHILLLDVCPLSLGLETMGGIVERLIHRNSPIPASAHQEFTTFADGQTGMDFHVVQGERELVGDCRSLAKFKLKGIPPMPAGTARVAVTFTIDADGLLRVAAREVTAGVHAAIEIKASYGLSEADIDRIIEDSYDHAEADIKERFLRDARVEAERILMAAERALEADSKLLDPAEIEAIRGAIAALREAKETATGHNIIMERVEALDRISAPFAQRRMNAGINRAIGGKSAADLAP